MKMKIFQGQKGPSKYFFPCFCKFSFQACRALSAIEMVTAGLQNNKSKDLELIETNERGEGVITNEDIEKGEFVVEYKYNEAYSQKQWKARQDEYAMNNEGCYVLEAQLPMDKGWICLDATRNTNSWGRYINHSATPNLKPHNPVMVRGKWRVGFVALRDIQKGEELFYDYGHQRNAPDWMKKRKVIQVANVCMLILHHFSPGQNTET